jgi:hypothetical protein
VRVARIQDAAEKTASCREGFSLGRGHLALRKPPVKLYRRDKRMLVVKGHLDLTWQSYNVGASTRDAASQRMKRQQVVAAA